MSGRRGYKIVIGIKTSSKENRLMYWLRSCYYKTIKKLSDVEQIEHFTGSGLYDREFIEVLRNLDDPILSSGESWLSWDTAARRFPMSSRAAGRQDP